ncbi:hypothetical protein OQA88_7734 [Cercophora sp. LCS_1]
MNSGPFDLPPPGTFSSYQQAYGSHVYIGDRTIDLQQQLQSLSTAPSGCPQYLHVFCDTLELPASSGQFGLVIPTGLRSIEIFARCFLSSSSHHDLVNPWVLNLRTAGSVVAIMICSEMLPAAVQLQDESTPGLTIVTNLSHACLPDTYPVLTPDQNTFVPLSDGLGVFFKADVNGYVAGSVRDIQDISPGQLEVSVADLIDVGNVQRPDYLGHLLETIFADAAGKTTDLSMASTVRSQFAFAAKCSRNSPSWSEFYLQARTMEQRLRIPDGSLWVKGVKFSDLEFTLDYRVRLATLLHADQETHAILSSIESSIKSVKELLGAVQDNILQSQQDLKAKIGQVGAIIVSNMGFSNDNFVAKEGDAQSALDEAKHSANALDLDFSDMQKECKKAQQSFEVGVKKWQAKQEEKAVIDTIVAVFECAVAIGSIFATEGADAGTAAPAAASAAKGIQGAAAATEKAESTWARIKKMFEKIKKCAEKIQAVQKAISQFNKTDASTNKAMTGVSSMKFVTGTVVPSIDTSVDFTELKLNWQEFQVDMNSEFSSLETDFKDVEGYADWKNSTQKLVLRALAVISATKNVQDKHIALTRIRRDAARVKAHQAELTALASQLNAQAALDAQAQHQHQPALPDTQLTAEQRQLRLRELVTATSQRAVNRWLFLDFHQYASATMYATARRDFPVALSATRSLANLLSDIITLKQTLGNAKTLGALSYPIEFNASDGVVSGEHWLSTVKETKALAFTIPRDVKLPVYDGHRILRVMLVEVYIDGLVPVTKSAKPSISISVTLGPESLVLVGGRWRSFWVDLEAMKFGRVTAPDGSELPDTDVHPRGVDQKAVFSVGDGAFAPSLFGSGFVSVLNPEDWKWDAVKDVRLCFYCQGD